MGSSTPGVATSQPATSCTSHKRRRLKKTRSRRSSYLTTVSYKDRDTELVLPGCQADHVDAVRQLGHRLPGLAVCCDGDGGVVAATDHQALGSPATGDGAWSCGLKVQWWQAATTVRNQDLASTSRPVNRRPPPLPGALHHGRCRGGAGHRAALTAYRAGVGVKWRHGQPAACRLGRRCRCWHWRHLPTIAKWWGWILKP